MLHCLFVLSSSYSLQTHCSQHKVITVYNSHFLLQKIVNFATNLINSLKLWIILGLTISNLTWSWNQKLEKSKKVKRSIILLWNNWQLPYHYWYSGDFSKASPYLTFKIIKCETTTYRVSSLRVYSLSGLGIFAELSLLMSSEVLVLIDSLHTPPYPPSDSVWHPSSNEYIFISKSPVKICDNWREDQDRSCWRWSSVSISPGLARVR